MSCMDDFLHNCSHVMSEDALKIAEEAKMATDGICVHREFFSQNAKFIY